MKLGLRKYLSQSLNLAPPDAEPEVTKLIGQFGLTESQVHKVYEEFRRLKKKEPFFGARTGPHEILAASVPKLVRNGRQWVFKILKYLLDLAGCRQTVTWNQFAYCLLQFCSLSKVELCQFMFFIIAMEMRTWTVHFITTTQLEEFYEEYLHCPVPSFNTAAIDFAKLPLAKYRMVDFIELSYRFSQLINPCLHLQRELQRSLPGMDFWMDYDVVKALNRQLGMDFFRMKKMLSIVDAVRLVKSGGTEVEDEAASFEPEVATREPPRDLTEKTLPGFVPLPLGPEQPPRWRPPKQVPNPDWMKEHLEQNIDPLRGRALGSAAEAARPPDIAPALPEGWVAVPDPERPKRLYYWNKTTNEVSWQPPPLPPQSVMEAKEVVRRTIGERLSRVKPGGLSEGLVTKPQGRNEKEVKDAMNRTMELDFVREARKHAASAERKQPPGLLSSSRDLFFRSSHAGLPR